ncbi:MAG: mechanosensitive ion channel [Geobacter sp.]|nr:mechanosensitive ion channel [Geobacter sp.]
MFLLLVRSMVFLVMLQASAWALDAPAASPQRSGVTVTILNRPVAVFRAPLLGVPVEERAQRAEEALRRLLGSSQGGALRVSSQKIPQGYSIMIDGVLAFMLTPEDSDPLTRETPEQTVQQTVAALEQVVRETRESRDLSSLAKASGYALAATVVLILAIWGLNRARRWQTARLLRLVHRHAERLSVGGEAIIRKDRLLVLVQHGVTVAYWLMVLVLTYEWVGFTLGRFPYTRPWGTRLNQYLIDLVLKGGMAAIRMLPDLFVALLIFLLARFAVQLVSALFSRIEQGQFEVTWLDRDTARPTRRLVSVAIWLFAFVMAYPYLPGSGTEAFKGLSVLVGLMISLGASSLVGQAASGLILMYTRTIRQGEYVEIASHQGTVVELGLFTTRILTGLGEELTLPNSLILNNVSRNYSRTVKGNGYILDTTVTIGYDTPWRQVHAMLIEAAARTPGILKAPPPQVFQTALSDFYPEYRLVCQAIPSEPTSRAAVMNTLHANIQDVFNEYGVQIMSPHYRGDPAEPKVVPRERWAIPPATEETR